MDTSVGDDDARDAADPIPRARSARSLRPVPTARLNPTPFVMPNFGFLIMVFGLKLVIDEIVRP